MVCDLGYLEDSEEKADWLTESVNDKGVWRTAPATPGLLNTRFSRGCFTSTFVIHSFIDSSFSSKSWDNFTPKPYEQEI